MRANIVTRLNLSACVTLRPVGVDDVSSVRHVHVSSFQVLSGEHHTQEETAAFADMIRRPEYGREVLNNNVYGAWIDGQIVGTAGWCPGDNRCRTARIRQVFVEPLFAGAGIGGLLLMDAENRALRAGFHLFSVRVAVSAVPFFERHGYIVSSHGVLPTPAGVGMPVVFMRKKNALKKVNGVTFS
jgi:putative acetyltransferase